jgi:uncharacterized protein (TIGR03663 family)
MHKLWFIGLLPVLLLAYSLRVPELAERPMHHDEANQAYRFGQLLEEGTYIYDADDHHGPSLYFFTLPIAWFNGEHTFDDTTEVTYRLLPVIFSLLLIVFMPLLQKELGRSGVLAGAVLTAISPAFAYYARFYIQESLLVFFTFATIAAGWHAVKSGSHRWAVLCGLSAGLMFATKETAVIAYAAICGAALLNVKWSGGRQVSLKIALIAAACAAAVAFVLFASFFTNMEGPLEAIMAFKGYFARGTGQNTDHVHSWTFYLRMLTFYRFDGGPVWSEGLFFGLGLVGCVLIVRKRVPAGCSLGFARFLMIYTILLTMIYSAIAYKTPWCILSFLHGWILLAGIAAAYILEWSRVSWSRGIVLKTCSLALIITLVVLSMGAYGMARRTVFHYAAYYRNPYVYAHTTTDFMRLMERIGDLSAVSSEGKGLYIQVVAKPDSTWPLPFYLRHYPNTGYWVDANDVPEAPRPDLIISSPSLNADPETYLSEYYGLRADTLLALHIDRTLWEAFLATRTNAEK